MSENYIEGDEELLENLNALLEVMNYAIVEAGLGGGEILLDAATARAPGPNLAMQIEEVDQEHVEVRIGPDDEHWYYRFFEFGAQPHEINVENRAALRFGAEAIFAASGEHPGTPAQPFLRPALDEKQDEVLKKMAQIYWARIAGATS